MKNDNNSYDQSVAIAILVLAYMLFLFMKFNSYFNYTY